MARLAGVDLPAKKRTEIGLTYIYGIGRTRSKSLCHRAGVNPDKKIADLTEDEINRIRRFSRPKAPSKATCAKKSR